MRKEQVFKILFIAVRNFLIRLKIFFILKSNTHVLLAPILWVFLYGETRNA